MRRRVWGFLHPYQWLSLSEVSEYVSRVKYLLARSNDGLANAHLTAQERRILRDNNSEIISLSEQILKRK